MKKFNFSLQKLMDYKEILLNEEKSKIQNIIRQIEECDENILKVNERSNFLSNHISLNTNYTVDVLINYNRYISDLKALKKAYLQKKIGLEKNLEQVRNKAKSLQKEYKTIDSLKEKKLEEYKRDMYITEQLELDDLVSSKRA